MKRIFLLLTIILSAFISMQAQAKTSYFKVVHVGSNDFLNMRSGPSVRYPVTSMLRPDAKRIKIIRWAKKRSGRSSWAKVDWQGRRGWVNAYYLKKYVASSNERVFHCAGTEPFWGVDIFKNTAKVHTLSGFDFTAPIVFHGRPMNTPAGTTITSAISGNNSVVLTIEKKWCNDGMSDTHYGYKTMLLINDKEALMGCCND